MEALILIVGVIGLLATALMVFAMVYMTISALNDDRHTPNVSEEQSV